MNLALRLKATDSFVTPMKLGVSARWHRRQRRLAATLACWGNDDTRSSINTAYTTYFHFAAPFVSGIQVFCSAFSVPQKQPELQERSWEPVSMLPFALPSQLPTPQNSTEDRGDPDSVERFLTDNQSYREEQMELS